MTCRWWHRWSRWEAEFEECPDGETGVFEIRSRRCLRWSCDMIEEEVRCVSSSAEVLRGLIP